VCQCVCEAILWLGSGRYAFKLSFFVYFARVLLRRFIIERAIFAERSNKMFTDTYAENILVKRATQCGNSGDICRHLQRKIFSEPDALHLSLNYYD